MYCYLTVNTCTAFIPESLLFGSYFPKPLTNNKYSWCSHFYFSFPLGIFQSYITSLGFVIVPPLYSTFHVQSPPSSCSFTFCVCFQCFFSISPIGYVPMSVSSPVPVSYFYCFIFDRVLSCVQSVQFYFLPFSGYLISSSCVFLLSLVILCVFSLLSSSVCCCTPCLSVLMFPKVQFYIFLYVPMFGVQLSPVQVLVLVV